MRPFLRCIAAIVSIIPLGGQFYAQTPTPPRAYDNHNKIQRNDLELLGHWPRGWTFAVKIVNGKAYYGDGADLVISDVMANGTLENHRRLTINGTVRDIQVIGTTVYVAAGKGGLVIVDVSNPDMPVQISGWSNADYHDRVRVSGGFAYLSNVRPEGEPFFFDGIRILDVSDNNNPVSTGFWQAGESDITGIGDFEIAGGTMYVSNWAVEGISVVDINEPSNPQNVTTYATSETIPTSLAVSGSNLFMALQGTGAIYSLDISNPTSPVLAGENAILTISDKRIEDIAIYDDLMIACDTRNNGELVLIDVSSPDSPSLDSVFNMDLNFDGNLLFCSQTDMNSPYLYFAALWGLLVYDFSNPQSPVLVANYPSGGTHFNIFADGDRLYTASSAGGMHILDAADPQNIGELGRLLLDDLPFAHSWHDLVVKDAEVFGALRTRVASFDVSDPGNIQMVDSAITGTRRLAVNGSILYAVNPVGTSTVFDIGEGLQQRGTFSSSFFSSDEVLYHDGHLYLSSFFEGVSINGLNSQSIPIEIATFEAATFTGYVGMAATGDILVVSDLIGGILRLVDISDPANPAQVGAVDLGTSIAVVAADGPYAYAGGGRSGLFLVDIFDPSDPFLITEYADLAEGVRDIFVTPNRIYVSASASVDAWDVSSGIYVFRNALSTDVTDDQAQLNQPKEFGLGYNYPNPFNPTTVVPFTLEEGGHAVLSVYNAKGSLITRLFDGFKTAGRHEVVWQAANQSSGVYYFQLNSGGKVDGRKGLLLK